MKNLWFKNKNYGYGWYPATWQGWVVMIVYVTILTLLILDFLPTARAPHDPNELPVSLWWYLGKVFLLTTVLILVARFTGEKPQWRWGGKKIERTIK